MLTGTAHSDHNVYIFGAGFAAEAGLPVIKDFMNRMRDAAFRTSRVVVRKFRNRHREFGPGNRYFSNDAAAAAQS